MKYKTNKEKLVMISIVGQISSPIAGSAINSYDGEQRYLPRVGGITYNVKVGDYACGWKADHIEPGVSMKNTETQTGPYGPNVALNMFAQIGNEAKIVTGDAKGKKGIVTGKHGGIEHVIIDFDDETLEDLVVGDKIQIKGYGTGLDLSDYPGVKVMNTDPTLLNKILSKKLPIKSTKGKLCVPVTHRVPAKIMGSGLGSAHCYTGDYDIQFADEKTITEYNLEHLRLGDIIAITDADHSHGRIYKTGAVSIGVVIHGDCFGAGHGPGVTTIMTAQNGEIQSVIDTQSNIGRYLNIGRYRK